MKNERSKINPEKAQAQSQREPNREQEQPEARPEAQPEAKPQTESNGTQARAKAKGEQAERKQSEQVVIPLNRRLLKYVLLTITFTVVLIWIINHFGEMSGVLGQVSSLISPFLIGACIAFVVNTLLCPLERIWNWIRQRRSRKGKGGNWIDRLKRPVCLLLSFIFVFGIVFAVVFMLTPQLMETVASLIDRLPEYVKNLDAWWNDVVTTLERYNIVLPELQVDTDEVVNSVKGFLADNGKQFLDTTLDITSSIVSVIVNIVLALVFSIYLLAQKETIGRQAKKALYAIRPTKNADRILRIVSLSHRTFTKFVTGQLTEAVIIGMLCFIGMLILRIPYAGVVAVLVGFTALIPVFGAFIGTAIGAFLILLVDPAKALWFIAYIIILQQLEGNLIYPKVVGKSVGLPGIWVLVAVTVGGSAFGIVGMLFGVPVCSVLYSVFSEFVIKRLQQRKLQGIQ